MCITTAIIITIGVTYPYSFIITIPLKIEAGFSKLTIDIASLSFDELLLTSIAMALCIYLILPSTATQLPVASVLRVITMILSTAGIASYTFRN